MPLKIKDKIYGVWVGMRQRCRNPNGRTWKHYGGRGIKVCERWNSYANFEADMGDRPFGTTLDRIDNNGNYEPGNCRWATKKEQLRNRRITRRVTLNGNSYLVQDLADLTGMKPDTICERAAQGLSYEKVISNERRVYKQGLALGGLANGARNRSKTHCLHGHEFTSKNTYFSKEGWRRCRRCRADRENLRRSRLSAAVARQSRFSLFAH